jgi:hypothetical protein
MLYTAVVRYHWVPPMLVPEIDSNSISQLYDHFTWDHQYLGVVGVPNFEKYPRVRLPDVVKPLLVTEAQSVPISTGCKTLLYYTYNV